MTKIAKVSRIQTPRSSVSQPRRHRIGVETLAFESARGAEFSWDSGNFFAAGPSFPPEKVWRLSPPKKSFTTERSVQFSYSEGGTLSEFRLLLPNVPMPALPLACTLGRLPIQWVIQQLPAPRGYTGLRCSVCREDGSALTASESSSLKAAVLVFVAQEAAMKPTAITDATGKLVPKPIASTREATSAGSPQAAG